MQNKITEFQNFFFIFTDMNLKNNYLLKNCWSGPTKNVSIFKSRMLYFFKNNREKHLEILLYTCVPKLLMTCRAANNGQWLIITSHLGIITNQLFWIIQWNFARILTFYVQILCGNKACKLLQWYQYISYIIAWHQKKHFSLSNASTVL